MSVIFVFYSCFYYFSTKIQVCVCLFVFFIFTLWFTRTDTISILLLFEFFSNHVNRRFNHWSLSDSKSSRLSSVFWLMLIMPLFVVPPPRPLISKSSSSCKNPLVTVQRASNTISIPVTFLFHSFFQFPSKDRGTYLSFRFLSILLCGHPGQQSPPFDKFSFSLLLLLLLLL